MSINEIHRQMKKLASRERAEVCRRYFKTGKGEYGEGDIFIGIATPDLRKLARQYRDISYDEVLTLLKSAIHEERVLALLILVLKYARAGEEEKAEIYKLYLSHTAFINNWDLVDLSAPHIIGTQLLKRDRKPLYLLAKSANLWERRIAILATFQFIRHGDFEDALKIAGLLLEDRHDLIHKAVGWMLRETGKRDRAVEEDFLRVHYRQMPRTMLRYAVEKFDEETRQNYLKGRI